MEQNLNKQQKRWLKLMKLGAVFGCHQLPQRSFFYKSYQFPVCARCTGIFFGQLLGILSYLLQQKPHFLILIGFLIPMIADGLIQLIFKKESNNLRRVITGVFAGYGYSLLFLYFILWLLHIFFQ